MTFKLLRRGSARCVGLLSAFVTILLCLYYISMGQPALPTKDSPSTNIGTSMVMGMGGNTGSMGGGAAALHLPLQRDFDDRLIPDDELLLLQRHKYVAAKVHPLHHHQQQQQQHPRHVHEPDPLDNEILPMAAARRVDWGEKCYVLDETVTNITAIEEYAKFDFQPEWVRTKEYWDRGFEDRFEMQKTDKSRPPLKIIVVPHSHNDPGWLKTFVNYFQSDSRQILNLMVTKMQEYTDMTFIWSEISFLQLWWDQAHPTKQRALKKLIQSGRLEITTGGWVMTDEANVHLYAMLDQLIEGHQWLRNNLNVTPTVGWSIDPFGHGSTVPYLLSGAAFEGAIIQRIHYAWKQWFARQQMGDFIWTPFWQQKGQSANEQQNTGRLLTHNMPFDIYSIKGSCGPHPFVCLNFDFRKIPGEYTEYSIKAQFITDDNVEEKAQLLLEQYARTASLFPHNVALIPVGDDFRYNKEREVDQQYSNYKKLIDHIMANKHIYKADISFGTPKDYFREIRRRSERFPTFKGDFFVYSDIFSEGRPAYWSGYFTTRPLFKILSADLEHNLRSAEILFTLAYNMARQHRHESAIKIYEKNYEQMIHARRNLGLFQHHDAITGTSKAAVMRDYGLRLFESIQDAIKMQQSTIELLIQDGTFHHNFLLSELERDSFNRLPRKTPIMLSTTPTPIGGSITSSSSSSGGGGGTGSVDHLAASTTDENVETAPQDPPPLPPASTTTNAPKKTGTVVLMNSLAQRRLEVVTMRVQSPQVKVLNQRGEEVRRIQINPVWNVTDPYEGPYNAGNSFSRLRITSHQYELMFVAELEPLSLTTYQIVEDKDNYKRALATVYCDECTDTTTPQPTDSNEFTVKAKPAGDIQLENSYIRLLFDEKSGFLKTITRMTGTNQHTPMQCAIKFAAYRSAQFHSGAYLFKTDPEQSDGAAEKAVLEEYEQTIIITTGPLASDVTVIYGPFLAHTVRLFETHTHLDSAILIENDLDFEPPPKNRETELFMRFITDIDNVVAIKNDDVLGNAGSTELPVFYTDQNGFQYHRRIKVHAVGIEGNYFPITTGAFMQDKRMRLTLLTTHAQGAASYEPGQLEVMLDRRTLYDDYRGMGEGIVDSRLTRHKFWLLLEDMPTVLHNKYQVPSLWAMQLSNGLRSPLNLYFIESIDMPSPQLRSQVSLLAHGALPCDVHLLNLRTLSEEQLQLFPSTSALLVLHRQGYDCAIGQNINLSSICPPNADNNLANMQFSKLQLERIETTGLTGITKANERQRLGSFGEIALGPMDLRTFNVTFRV